MNDTTNIENPKPPPEGIYGWLILPAIGLILALILDCVAIFLLLQMLPQFSDIGQRSLIIVDIAGSAFLFILTIKVALNFFRKMKSAPRLYIALLLSNLALQILLIFISAVTGPEEMHKHYFKGIGRAIFLAGVWIFYFKESKRVKATFTK